MRVTLSNKTVRVEAESLGDYVNWIEKDHRPGGTHVTHPADSWSGGTDLEGTIKLARHGWPEGLQRIAIATDKITGKASDLVKQYRWDVTGQFFDVGEMLTGNPEHWLEPDPEDAPRVHRIGLNISKSCSVSGDQIMNLGGAVASLVDLLQQQGDIVELDIIEYATGLPAHEGCTNSFVTIPIDTRPLDLDTVAFVAAHPAMLRRLILVGNEISFERDECGGYGRPADPPHPDRQDYTLYIGTRPTPNGMREFNTVDSAAQWVAEQIEKINNAPQ